MTGTTVDQDVKQLRLALVCYGGVSLAVYMHGVTKELYKLVRASRQFDQDRDTDTVAIDAAGRFPAPAEQPADAPVEFDTEPVYYAALAKLQARTPISAAIDVIAGTSAGGINGVFLARAVAQGRSLNGLRSLWIKEGDLEGLLKGRALVPAPRRARMLSKLGVALARLVREKHRADAPLNGTLMSQLLHRALADMRPVTSSLVQADGSIDLYTTMTDVEGYGTAVPTGTGGLSHTDRSFRQVMGFHFDPRTADGATPISDNFSDDYVPALAFAARATSSFPGAFPAVDLDTFAAAVNDARPGSVTDQSSIARLFRYCGEFGSEPEHAWYMDGGVLDNGPFDHVISAIARKRADGPVARELIYIEPDPGGGPKTQTRVGQPEWLKLILAAKMTIPAHTSLVAALGQLRDMNLAISDVAAVANSQQDLVVAAMTNLGLGHTTDYQTLIDDSKKIHEATKSLAGLGFSAYCRLRAEALADEIAALFAKKLGYPPESNRCTFVAAVLQCWLRGTRQWGQLSPADLEDALGRVDVPFRLRRANFVLQGINRMLADTTLPAARRRQLSTLKSSTWDLIEQLRQTVDEASSEALPYAIAVLGKDQLTDGVALSDPKAYATANEPALTKLFTTYSAALSAAGSSTELWATFQTNTDGWTPAERDTLISRYLMFPVWDAILFPIVAMAKLPQLSPISVTRFSPLDATCLTAPGTETTAARKLRGVAIHHFGGFFEESWREHDYLWGRLDGAELIMRLLTKHGGDVDLTAELQQAFNIILESERAGLPHLPNEIEDIAKLIPDVDLRSTPSPS
jgi:patatin-related protein